MPKGDNPNSRANLELGKRAFAKDKEIARRAQRNSVESYRARKTFREEFELELAAIIKDKSGNETTIKNAISKQTVQKALKGDLRAIEFIRDTIGEKPAENLVLHEADPLIIQEIEAMVDDKS